MRARARSFGRIECVVVVSRQQCYGCPHIPVDDRNVDLIKLRQVCGPNKTAIPHNDRVLTEKERGRGRGRERERDANTHANTHAHTHANTQEHTKPHLCSCNAQGTWTWSDDVIAPQLLSDARVAAALSSTASARTSILQRGSGKGTTTSGSRVVRANVEGVADCVTSIDQVRGCAGLYLHHEYARTFTHTHTHIHTHTHSLSFFVTVAVFALVPALRVLACVQSSAL